MTTSTKRRAVRGPYRRRTAGNRSRPLPPTRQLLELVPPGWTPVHRAVRATTPAWCLRCDQFCRLPFGPGEGLCQPCRDGELADEMARRGYHPVTARRRARRGRRR